MSRSDNNRITSGLPHSEIGGSGPITGFPPLIAGYHVLHRLLLPRHPPNALIALDLIQKEPDIYIRATASLLERDGSALPLRYLSAVVVRYRVAHFSATVLHMSNTDRAFCVPCPYNPDQKHCTFPIPLSALPLTLLERDAISSSQEHLVSVLDLDSLMSCSLATAGPPPLGRTDMTLMCISLNDVKMRGGPLGVQQDDRTHARMNSMIVLVSFSSPHGNGGSRRT